VRQSGSEEGVRWQRYYSLIAAGWESSLDALKHHLEHRGPGAPATGKQSG